MWDCECGLKFKDPDIGITCPMCGSMNIVEIGDIIPDWDTVEGAKKSKEQIDKLKNDLDEMCDYYLKREIAKVPERLHLNCYYAADQIKSTPLSFDDLEINEMCLLDLETNDQDCIEMTFFTDMNSRFLRTFLGEPVWA